MLGTLDANRGCQLVPLPSEISAALGTDWLQQVFLDIDRIGRRVKPIPAFSAGLFANGRCLNKCSPLSDSSALLALLHDEMPMSGGVVVAGIESSVAEADLIARYATNRDIRAIVFAALHPDRDQQGQGFQALRRTGTRVYWAGKDALIAEGDRRFWVWASKRRSYVHLKISLTSDGAMVPIPGQTTRLAGNESRARIHALRGRHDGLVLGAGTVRQDDPQMTYRGVDDLPQPRKIILSRSGKLGIDRRACQGDPPLICANDDLEELARNWAAIGITSVLVEGGAEVYRQFIEQQVVDEMSLVWTRHRSAPGAVYLPTHIPYGQIVVVGDDVWEIIRWSVMGKGHVSPRERSCRLKVDRQT